MAEENVLETLLEMGFSEAKSKLAISSSQNKSLQDAMEWILAHEDDDPAMDVETASSNTSNTTANPEPAEATSSTEKLEDTTEDAEGAAGQVAKSIKCDDCGALFKDQTTVEYHAAKTGHENFSESTEEKKPLTEDEKKEQLAKIEAKIKQRKLEREAREKQEALDREKNRIKSGKEMTEAKKKQEDLEMKKLIEQRRRDKEEERLARQRVKEQIEQDKLMRKAKFGQGTDTVVQAPKPAVDMAAAAAASEAAAKAAAVNYTQVRLQIRLTNGAALTHTFGAKEPLSAVRLFVEMNRTDEPGPFSLMTSFSRKVFTSDDFDKPLDVLGLAPSAVLIVRKG